MAHVCKRRKIFTHTKRSRFSHLRTRLCLFCSYLLTNELTFHFPEVATCATFSGGNNRTISHQTRRRRRGVLGHRRWRPLPIGAFQPGPVTAHLDKRFTLKRLEGHDREGGGEEEGGGDLAERGNSVEDPTGGCELEAGVEQRGWQHWTVLRELTVEVDVSGAEQGDVEEDGAGEEQEVPAGGEEG